ncbi:MAG TPA: hypothetical protein VKZ65_06620 [Glycomyces sp.]|jgi:Flp pilus assembly protein TadB|nr:hypothetical protein [Glycomyces sp.]
MTDRYRLSEPTGENEDGPGQTAPASNGTDMLLWIVLVLAVFANVALSVLGLEMLGIPFGLIVLATGVTLLVRFFQRRR